MLNIHIIILHIIKLLHVKGPDGLVLKYRQFHYFLVNNISMTESEWTMIFNCVFLCELHLLAINSVSLGVIELLIGYNRYFT